MSSNEEPQENTSDVLTSESQINVHVATLEKIDIELPGYIQSDKLAFYIDNVFTKQECDEFIRKSEEIGFTMAKINIGRGRQKSAPEVRNNSRCYIDSFEESENIWERIKQFVPRVWNGHEALGLNERLRVLRYDEGEYFAPHWDGSYQRDNKERSYITVQLYLNEGFEGGATTFLPLDDSSRSVKCIPKIGRILVFQHDILHEGSVLESGRKYAIRTDVMYSPDIYVRDEVKD
ncbi:uncharacterized protein LOC102806073 [Saccoglossus kowalevskii]|uniref:Uncharacterized protein LOC102806073 n=1 Tax=Saccoglossus kowalevskii TaxID=10224 RepID=A0ABM0M0S2_SACKO|nr:PREDICTED: uncharacterized protein LOC102806073 [Saccoglossus kowalevskii]